MEIGNRFQGMTEFGSEDPGSFFISAFITSSMDKVEKFSGVMLIVNLGIKDFRNFKFRFIIDCNWRRWGLDLVGNQVGGCWFQH